MSDLFDVRGKTALVTGASRGLGFAIAAGLARAGAKVAANARDGKRLETATRKLASLRGEAHAYPFDVTDEKAIQEAVADIEKKVGPIEILVNNAGRIQRGKLEEVEEKDFRAVLETNLIGPFLVAKEAAKRMIPRKRGKIINIVSVMSFATRPTVGAYTASKGGLALLTKSMAAEWGPHGIQANAIAPGYFETDLTKDLVASEEFSRWVRERAPAGRWGKPEDLVGAALFLSSSASDFVNGQVLAVDGGFLARL